MEGFGVYLKFRHPKNMPIGWQLSTTQSATYNSFKHYWLFLKT